MRYYKLVYDYENDDNYVNCDIANIGNMNEYITSNGKVIDKWDEVVFKYDSSEGNVLTDCLANVYRWYVVSDDFRKYTDDIIGEQVQYLPVTIVDKRTKAEISTYCVANIVTLVDALDLENSKYDIFELDDEKIISVEKYVLKQNKILKWNIFRLKGDTIPIFASELVKNVIEDKGLLGFRFLEVDIN